MPFSRTLACGKAEKRSHPSRDPRIWCWNQANTGTLAHVRKSVVLAPPSSRETVKPTRFSSTSNDQRDASAPPKEDVGRHVDETLTFVKFRALSSYLLQRRARINPLSGPSGFVKDGYYSSTVLYMVCSSEIDPPTTRQANPCDYHQDQNLRSPL